MSKEIIQFLLDIIKRTDFPEARLIDEENLRLYERGLEIVTTYRGDPLVLVQAIEIFEATATAPYYIAGMAYVLMAGSFVHNNLYEWQGLNEAQRWLSEAQAIAPNHIEIDFLEAILYIYGENYNEARKVLDHLSGVAHDYFFYRATELLYFSRQSAQSLVMEAYEFAMEVTHSNVQKLHLLNIVSRYYLRMGAYFEYIRFAKQISQIDPNDPWLWHNMSVALMRLGKYEEARMCNKKALELMDFEAARRIERHLRTKKWWPF